MFLWYNAAQSGMVVRGQRRSLMDTNESRQDQLEQFGTYLQLSWFYYHGDYQPGDDLDWGSVDWDTAATVTSEEDPLALKDADYYWDKSQEIYEKMDYLTREKADALMERLWKEELLEEEKAKIGKNPCCETDTPDIGV